MYDKLSVTVMYVLRKEEEISYSNGQNYAWLKEIFEGYKLEIEKFLSKSLYCLFADYLFQ